jgi:hypothetical protein
MEQRIFSAGTRADDAPFPEEREAAKATVDAGGPPIFDIEGPSSEERVMSDADTLRKRLALD